MKVAKVFDYLTDIKPILEGTYFNAADVFELLEPNNDTAKRWWVDANADINSYSELEVFLNKYFISAGCADDEMVFIWFCW